MKKILLKVMAVVMVIMLLSGCGEKPSESPDAEASPDPTPSSTPIEQNRFRQKTTLKTKCFGTRLCSVKTVFCLKFSAAAKTS